MKPILSNESDWSKKVRNIKRDFFSNEKDKAFIKNVIYAFFIKGGALVISLLSLPAFIKYFDNQVVLGVWFTILSVLTWILTFDLGIGNGLRNKLVGAIVRNEKLEIRQRISSAYFVIGIITILCVIISVIVFPKINWNSIFNISETLISPQTMLFVIMCTFVTIMLQFFLRLVSFILYALQKSSVNNLLALLTSIAMFVFVIIAPSYDVETNMKMLSVAFLLFVNLPLLFASIIVFRSILVGCYPSLKFLHINSIKEIITLGGIFFWNQIMFTAITQTNLLLITIFIGPESVVDYQIYYKLFTVVGILFNLALTPLWSSITKAIEEKDVPWITKYFKLLNWLVLIVAICQLIFVPLLQFVLDFWLGSNSISVNYFSATLFAVYGGVFIFQTVLSTFACGLGRMRLQAFCYTVGVIIKLIFVYYGTAFYSNWDIIVMSDILILTPYCIAQWIVLKRHFYNLLK